MDYRHPIPDLAIKYVRHIYKCLLICNMPHVVWGASSNEVTRFRLLLVDASDQNMKLYNAAIE